MFWTMPSSFYPTFQPEACLENEEQINCYKARAKALRPRFPWSSAIEPIWNATLIHLSANVPGKVAYYADIKSMMANRLTRTSPEMFLERTLIYAPDELRAAWSVEVLGQTLPEISFIENTDPEGWIQIYDEGPNSCMQGERIVQQYAHPDNHLALAYHRRKNGQVTQRVIVNKERKTYLRIYGTADVSFFVAALNKLGYRQSQDTLDDEKVYLSYTQCYECGGDMLAGPYLDGGSTLVKTLNRKEGIISRNGGDEWTYSDEPHCGCGEDDGE